MGLFKFFIENLYASQEPLWEEGYDPDDRFKGDRDDDLEEIAVGWNYDRADGHIPVSSVYVPLGETNQLETSEKSDLHNDMEAMSNILSEETGIPVMGGHLQDGHIDFHFQSDLPSNENNQSMSRMTGRTVEFLDDKTIRVW